MLKRTLLVTGCILTSGLINAKPLSLNQAEAMAVARSAETKALKKKSRVLHERAILKSQLPDPKLFLGAVNVPTDTFDFAQENMTQVQIGLEQSFPKGESLKYQYYKEEALSKAEVQNVEDMSLKVRQAVRLNWAALAFWRKVRLIHQKEQAEFEHLVKMTNTMLANNKNQQQDVFRAKLGLTGAKNKLLNDVLKIEQVKVALARLIGPEKIRVTHPESLPSWPLNVDKKRAQAILLRHPALSRDASLIASKDAEVKLAKEQFKPGFMVGGAYGLRQGTMGSGMKRPDFVSLRLGISAPLFPKNRQARQLSAVEKEKASQQAMKLEHFRRLYQQYQKTLIDLATSKERLNLYQRELLPESKLYVQSTLTAYQNAKTDFPTLARAYVREFSVEIEVLKAELEKSVSEINLRYLQGK